MLPRYVMRLFQRDAVQCPASCSGIAVPHECEWPFVIGANIQWRVWSAIDSRLEIFTNCKTCIIFMCVKCNSHNGDWLESLKGRRRRLLCKAGIDSRLQIFANCETCIIFMSSVVVHSCRRCCFHLHLQTAVYCTLFKNDCKVVSWKRHKQ